MLNTTQSCLCIGGASGVQECVADASGVTTWSVCVCGEEPADGTGGADGAADGAGPDAVADAPAGDLGGADAATDPGTPPQDGTPSDLGPSDTWIPDTAADAPHPSDATPDTTPECTADWQCPSGEVSGEVCKKGVCIGGKCALAPAYGEPCNLGDPCALYVCAEGGCQFKSLVVCYDGDDCTADSCASEVGCQFTPISGCCTKNADCASTDVCLNGVCQAPIVPSCPNDDSWQNVIGPQSPKFSEYDVTGQRGAVAMGQLGSFVAGWVKWNGSSEASALQRFTAKGEPSGGPATCSACDKQDPRPPAIAIDATGNTLMATVRPHNPTTGTYGGIQVAWFDPQGKYLKSQTFAQGASEIHGAPELAVGPDLAVLAYTAAFPGTGPAGYLIYLFAPDNYEGAFAVTNMAGFGVSGPPAVAVGSEGRVTFAFTEPSSKQVVSVEIQKYGVLQAIIIASDAQHAVSAPPAVAMGPAGRVVVAYTDAYDDLWARVYGPGGELIQFIYLSAYVYTSYEGGYAARAFDLGMNGDSNWVVTYRASNYYVYARRYRLDGEPITDPVSLAAAGGFPGPPRVGVATCHDDYVIGFVDGGSLILKHFQADADGNGVPDLCCNP